MGKCLAGKRSDISGTGILYFPSSEGMPFSRKLDFSVVTLEAVFLGFMRNWGILEGDGGEHASAVAFSDFWEQSAHD